MLPDTSQSMDTPANTPKTPLDTSKHPQTHQTHPPVPRNNLDYSQVLIRQFARHLVCQGVSGRTLRVMRVSDAVCWKSGLFVSVKGCLWQCLGYVKGDMGVCGDIWGSLGGVGGCKGPQNCVWLTFPFNFLQIPPILGSRIWDPWHFPVDLEVPDVSSVRVSRGYGHFELVGGLGRSFKAEI